MKNVTDIVRAISNFEEPVVTDPKEIIKGEYHEKDGNWFNSIGRFAGKTAEEVIKRYRLYDREIKAYAYYVVDKEDYDKLVDSNVITTKYASVYLIGLYLGGLTKEEVIDAIK